MYLVINEELELYYYYNKKENAIAKAIVIYNKGFKDYAKEWYDGDIEKAKEECDYKNEIEEIKKCNHTLGCWVTIKKIKTED